METILIFGALGGVARGLVGYSKYFRSYRDLEFSWPYFGMTVGISTFVGFLAVWAIDGAGVQFAEGVNINPAIALIIGYAGGDAVENIYKIIAKQPILGPLGNILGRK